MELGLAGHVALVTGSYRGTGRGIARVLAREGATLLIHAFERAPAEAVVSELRASGAEAYAVVGSLTDDEAGESLVDQILAPEGRVDVLVNNYGVAEGAGWFEASSADWHDTWEKNVLSGVRLVRALVPGMLSRGAGRVIFVGTVGTTRPGTRPAHYYAAKAALPNMTVGLARELSGSGVTVNCVSPGLIATDELRERFLRMGERRGWGSTWEEVEPHVASEVMPNPTGRIGTPEEVGALVAFLASEHARYINGSNLRIDGGAADAVG